MGAGLSSFDKNLKDGAQKREGARTISGLSTSASGSQSSDGLVKVSSFKGLRQHAFSSSGSHQQEEKDAPLKEPFAAVVNSDAIRGVTEFCNISTEQRYLLELWRDEVFDPATPNASAEGRMLLLSSDLTILEIGIRGNWEAMTGYAGDFLEKCALTRQCDGALGRLKNLQKVAQTDELWLWLRLKHMPSRAGGSRGSEAPACDIGYRVEEGMEWVLADLLMPNVADFDSLRAYSLSNQCRPVSYGRSLLPQEPESALTLDIGCDNEDSRLGVLAGLFVYRELTFAKPEDATVAMLLSGEPEKCRVLAAMGPKGLTRLSLRMFEPRRPIAEDLAEVLSLAYSRDDMLQISEIMNMVEVENLYTFLDYAISVDGYEVSVGFIQ